MTTHEPGGADTNQATLNTRANSLAARANQAWIEARDPDTGFSPFAHQRHAFEEGWETGYKAAVAEIVPPTVEEVERVAHALYADNEVGEWEYGELDTLLQYRRAARVALEAYTGRTVGGVTTDE